MALEVTQPDSSPNGTSGCRRAQQVVPPDPSRGIMRAGGRWWCRDGAQGGGRFTSAHVNFSPVVTPGRSPIRGWRPLLPSLRSHPPGSSEFVVGLTATSGNFLSRPSGRLFMPGPREPANFPSSASATPGSARGVDFVEEFRGSRGMLKSSVRECLGRRGRCQLQLDPTPGRSTSLGGVDERS